MESKVESEVEKMNAIVLYKTDFQIDCDKTNIREQINEFFDDSDNYDIKEFTNNESMFQLIYDALGSRKIGVTACNIRENRDFVYVGYFVDVAEILDYGTEEESEEKILEKIKDTYTKAQLSTFGSQITAQHVTGNLIIIKNRLVYDINNNNVKTSMNPVTITLTELKDIIENTLVKDGIVIETDGKMCTYNYIMNPIEHLMLSEKDYKDNYVYHEYEVYTHVMLIVADTREINGTVNKTATMLAGKIVKGTVFVAMYKKPEYNENPLYVGISIEQLKKILEIRKRSVELTTGMSQSDKEYINFDKILELECSKHSTKPIRSIESSKGCESDCLNKK